MNNEVLQIDELPSTNINLLTDFNHTKSKKYNNHYNIKNRIDMKIFWADSNITKSKSCRNHCDISNTIVSKEILVTKDRQTNYCNLYLF